MDRIEQLLENYKCNPNQIDKEQRFITETIKVLMADPTCMWCRFPLVVVELLRLFSLPSNQYTRWFAEHTNTCLSTCPECVEVYYLHRFSLFQRYKLQFEERAVESFVCQIELFDVNRISSSLQQFLDGRGVEKSRKVLMAIFEALYYANWIGHSIIRPLFDQTMQLLISSKKMLKVHRTLGGIFSCLFHQERPIRSWAQSVFSNAIDRDQNLPPESFQFSFASIPNYIPQAEFEVSMRLLLKWCPLAVLESKVLSKLPNQFGYDDSNQTILFIESLLQNIYESLHADTTAIINRIIKFLKSSPACIFKADNPTWLTLLGKVVIKDQTNPSIDGFFKLLDCFLGLSEEAIPKLLAGLIPTLSIAIEASNYDYCQALLSHIYFKLSRNSPKRLATFSKELIKSTLRLDIGTYLQDSIKPLFEFSIELFGMIDPNSGLAILSEFVHLYFINNKDLPFERAIDTRIKLLENFTRFFIVASIQPLEYKDVDRCRSIALSMLVSVKYNVMLAMKNFETLFKIYPDLLVQSLYQAFYQLQLVKSFNIQQTCFNLCLIFSKAIYPVVIKADQDMFLEQFPAHRDLKLKLIASCSLALYFISDHFASSSDQDNLKNCFSTFYLIAYLSTDKGSGLFLEYFKQYKAFAASVIGAPKWINFLLKHIEKGEITSVQMFYSKMVLVLKWLIGLNIGLHNITEELKRFVRANYDYVNIRELEAILDMDLKVPYRKDDQNLNHHRSDEMVGPVRLQPKPLNRHVPTVPVMGSKLSQIRDELRREVSHHPNVNVAKKRSLVQQPVYNAKAVKLVRGDGGSNSESEENEHRFVIGNEFIHQEERMIRESTRSIKVIDIVGESTSQALRSKGSTGTVKGKQSLAINRFWEFLLSMDYNHLKNGQVMSLVGEKYAIPTAFAEESHYIQVFEPLLQLECESQIIRSIAEASEPIWFEGRLVSLSHIDKLHEVTLELECDENNERPCGENDLIVMQLNSDGAKKVVYMLGLVTGFAAKNGNIMRCTIKLFFQPPHVYLQSSLREGKWFSVRKLCNVITSIREYLAMGNIGKLGLSRAILKPELHSFDPRPFREAILTVKSRLSLNESQATAIVACLNNTSPFTLIQGPPGTGKTRVIEGLLSALFGRPSADVPKRLNVSRVLICAPSNAAVDEIVLRIKGGIIDMYGHLSPINVLRIGSIDMIHDGVKDVTLDSLVEKRYGNAQKKSVELLESQRNTVSSIQKELNMAEATGDEEAVRRLKSSLWEAKENVKKNIKLIDDTRQSIRIKILSEAQVICCTLSSSGIELLSTLTFEVVIIDEACQAVELSTLIPLQYGCKHCVMVGDPNQLPPTVLSYAATAYEYEQSLFQRLQKARPDSVFLLGIQYRMHPDISHFPNHYFYDAKLTDDSQMKTITSRPWHNEKDGDEVLGTYRFFDVHGTENIDKRSLGSMMNELEARSVLNIVLLLCSQFPKVNFFGKIGIITPYKQQRRVLKRLFLERFGKRISSSIEISTVDSFQGQEKDIIIFSCVRTGETGGIGFLNDARRMNVALTRAKCSLFVFGKAAALSRHPLWARLIEDSRLRGKFVSHEKKWWIGNSGGDYKNLLDPPTTGNETKEKIVARPSKPTPIVVHVTKYCYGIGVLVFMASAGVVIIVTMRQGRNTMSFLPNDGDEDLFSSIIPKGLEYGDASKAANGLVSNQQAVEMESTDEEDAHGTRSAKRVKDALGTHEKVLDTFSQNVEQKIAGPEAAAESEAGGTSVLSLTHEVRHDVAIPEGYAYVPLNQHVYNDPPARVYPFTLDPFQKLAVACIERSESVLVSAHTSAGKTVVAEYAIATALKSKQRVIYTSPIKALSNQKYRELNEEFGDVGLMTGDVTINSEASCLVMTTEILRSMLYRGSEVMREVSWVIFDEIHYMRDKERGVVWEETLILLPKSIRYVFLSATIPNAKQFVRWICNIHAQPCHVVYTNYRPTPLQHYLFPSGGDGVYLAVDEKGTFREDNFKKALNVFGNDPNVLGEEKRGRGDRAKNKGKPTKGPSDLYKIIKMILAKNYQPVIVFSFSKRECENLAMQVSKLDFNIEEEKRLVSSVFENAIESLSPEDRTLPQIEGILPLLKRGIGVHHSGLLPILKEVIEILFQEGLLKVLFATETFSIGLNMPARTVVFTSVRKFDGKDFRWISGGEYIQMSGRAGRRGLDSRGIVILMIEEKMEPTVAKGMLKGQADPLNSAFHLSYNMILNLMRVEGTSSEYMLEHSFFQFQNSDTIPELETQLNALIKQKESITVEREKEISEYYNIRAQLDALRSDIRKVIHHPSHILSFLQPGRLVRVCDDKNSNLDFGWCVVVNFQKKAQKFGGKDQAKSGNTSEASYIVDVVANCAKLSEKHVYVGPPKPAKQGELGEMMVIPVTLSVLDGVSSVRLYLPKDLKPAENRQTLGKTLQEVHKRFPDGIPHLDPVEDMGIKDDSFKKLIEKVEKLEGLLFAHPLHRSLDLPLLYTAYKSKMGVVERINGMKRQIKDANSIMQMDELKSRKRVLRRLGYVNENDVIELKGRVACEISTGDELLLTEMMFSGVFGDLTAEQIVALMSCFVFQEKGDEPVKLKEDLSGPLRIMQDAARRIAQVSTECKLPVNAEEYVQQFRPELMDVVYAWCKGAKFAKICRMTDVFEGSIIRCMRRLEELLRQMALAAKSIGNHELENKFAEGIAKLKRDIVFANSLYL